MSKVNQDQSAHYNSMVEGSNSILHPAKPTKSDFSVRSASTCGVAGGRRADAERNLPPENH